jgi:predicted short-subunit dehydrogenase-like oxidoreductase (DUF2520 family)
MRLPLTAVASSRRERAVFIAEQMGAGVAGVAVRDLAQRADLIFLTVPDSQVSLACEQLQLSAAHSAVHMSGALGLAALASASAGGARCGVMHPLQAFPQSAGAERFQGIHVGIEADGPELERELQSIARTLGATAFSLQGVDRTAYHAAAVFTSNYVVALHVAAARSWELAGLPASAARAALSALTAGASLAIAQNELPAALTGPIARGDVGTLSAHLQGLEHQPELLALYRALGRQLLTLPLTVDDATRAELTALLTDPEPAKPA